MTSRLWQWLPILSVAALGWLACGRIAPPEDAARPTAAGADAGAEEHAALPPPAGAPEPALERFVVKARDPAQAHRLAGEVAARYGARAVVRPLFEAVDGAGDPDGMGRMFRVAIPRSELPTDNPFDNARAIRRSLALEAAEPDLELTQEPELEMDRLCLADDPPPADKTWSLRDIRAVQAWELDPAANGRRFGEGVRVCHPDTGWSEHVELDSVRLDLAHAINLLGSGTADGRDPLDYEGPLLHPGHGTGTGSVIVSEHGHGELLGVAPAATLVPIRTAKSVVQVFDSDLARAVNYSVDAGCDVVSMSLGGRNFFGLQAAIRRAVRHQLIVAAAAGNCVRFVVAPAAYDETLAIAGTNVHGLPWRGSSRGRAVDVSAPAEHVWVASRHRASDPTDAVSPGQGTSYAVANVAGSAALWLAFHGRATLLARYGTVPLQDVFRALLRRSARVPAGWDADRFGAGILDVEALLAADLPPPGMFVAPPTERAAGELAILAAMVDRAPADLGALLAERFGVPPIEVEDRLREVGPELSYLALSDPRGFERWLAGPVEEAGGGVRAPLAGASAELRGLLRGSPGDAAAGATASAPETPASAR